MTTEAEHMAAFAWERMYDWAMPPLVALDMVQDVTGERDAALAELLAAAVRWYEARKPQKNYRQRKLAEGAAAILALLCEREWHLAGRLRKEAAIFSCARLAFADGGQNWADWLHEGKRLIYLCGELEASAGLRV